MVKIEEKLDKPDKAPIEIVCIFSGDPEAEQKKRAAIEDYRKKYGCLDNLRILHTHCPEPLPLPEGLRPAR